MGETAGENRDGGLAERHQDGEWKNEEEGDPPVVHQHGSERVPGPGTSYVVDPPTLDEPLAVPDDRVGHDDDTGTDQLGPPAEVDVLAPKGHLLVEATEQIEQIGANEHAGGRDREDVADRVVLLLIALAWLDDLVGDREPVDDEPDVLKPVGFVPVDELGPDDSGVAPQRLHHHGADGVGRQHDVVMAQEQEGGTPLVVEDRVGRGSVPGMAPGLDHVCVGQHLVDPLGQLPAVRGIDDDHRESFVVLGGQRVERLPERSFLGFVGHHHDLHGRRRVPARDRVTVRRIGGGCRPARFGAGRIRLIGGHDRRRLPARIAAGRPCPKTLPGWLRVEVPHP